MQRPFASDVQIAFKRMICVGKSGWICARQAFPMQLNSGDLDLFDFNQQRVAREAIPHSCMKNGNNREQDPDHSSNNPRRGGAGKVAEGECQQRTRTKDNPARRPILSTDHVELISATSQPLNLRLKLPQTTHISHRSLSQRSTKHTQKWVFPFCVFCAFLWPFMRMAAWDIGSRGPWILVRD